VQSRSFAFISDAGWSLRRAEGKTYMPAMTLKTVMKLLPESKFVRVHKSFVIPVSGIKSFNHETVSLDRTKIPIGRTFLKDFLERMRRLSTAP
jgi:DNA-binding LytR/AlgR family response regulator